MKWYQTASNSATTLWSVELREFSIYRERNFYEMKMSGNPACNDGMRFAGEEESNVPDNCAKKNTEETIRRRQTKRFVEKSQHARLSHRSRFLRLTFSESKPFQQIVCPRCTLEIRNFIPLLLPYSYKRFPILF